MKKIKHTLGIFTLLLCSMFGLAQTEGVSIKTTVGPPHASAMLDIESATKGLLIPRVQLSSIGSSSPVSSPTTGLLIYNLTASVTGGTGFYYWSGSSWTKIANGNGGNLWNAIPSSTNDIQYPTGKVRVGSSTITPNYQLDVAASSGSYCANFRGMHGQVRIGYQDTLSAGGSPGNLIGHVAGLFGGGTNYTACRYTQGFPDNVKGFEVTTFGRAVGGGASWTTVDTYSNSLTFSSNQNIYFVPNLTGTNSPFAYFNNNAALLYTSDSTLKRNISNESSVISAVNSIRPVTFKWKSNPGGSVNHGVLAQELEAIFPELVTETTTPEDLRGTTLGSTGITKKGVNYTGLITILLKAIQENSAEIESLKTRVYALEHP